jgi:hypothetical protein
MMKDDYFTNTQVSVDIRKDIRDCQFGRGCRSYACKFNHPDRSPCPLGESCIDPACIFNHEIIKWKVRATPVNRDKLNSATDLVPACLNTFDGTTTVRTVQRIDQSLLIRVERLIPEVNRLPDQNMCQVLQPLRIHLGVVKYLIPHFF